MVKNIRHKTRQTYSAEEKIRIALNDGMLINSKLLISLELGILALSSDMQATWLIALVSTRYHHALRF